MDKENVRPIDAAIAQLKATYTPDKGRPSEDADNQPPQTSHEDHPPADNLLWPPPGLERIHGELSRLTAEFGLGVAILVVPLIWSTLSDAVSVGGWGTVATLVVDFVLLVYAYIRLRQLLAHATSAIEAGYPRALVWHVASDTPRDAAQLVQAKGVFTGISKASITKLLSIRAAACSCALLGVLWPAVTFPIIAVLGATGVLPALFVWLTTLVPAGVLLAASAYFRLSEAQLKSRARPREAVDRERRAQVEGWSAHYSKLGVLRSRSKNTIELQLATGGVWIAATLLLVPIAMAAVTAVIPQLALRTAGGYSVEGSLATLSSLRQYRVPPDSVITPAEAGQALVNLSALGAGQPRSPVMKAATRTYPKLPAVGVPHLRFRPDVFADSIFEIAGRDLPDSIRAVWDSAANHPAHEDFTKIARAPQIDVAGERWHFDIADTIPAYRLEFGSGIPRSVGNARVIRAALQLELGDATAAEISLKEMISAGLALEENALSGVEMMYGIMLLRQGTYALAALYARTGRVAEAATLRAILEASQGRLLRRGRVESFDELWRYVYRQSNPRGARWETFGQIRTFAPCMSLHAAILGPDADDKERVQRARKALVRMPSEERFFQLLERGSTVVSKKESARCTPRVLRGYRRAWMGY